MATEVPVPSDVPVLAERTVAGGVVLGHDPGGRVVLCEGALPGESVIVSLRVDKARFARGEVVEVVEPSPARREPPCPHVTGGCGGCDLQHAEEALQRQMKEEVVRDALQHLAGLPAGRVPVVTAGSAPPFGHRTTLRVAVHDGVAGLRHRRSNIAVQVPGCAVAAPALHPLLAARGYGTAESALLRCSAATGERLVVLDPTAAGHDLDDTPGGPVEVVGIDELAAGRRVWMHEDIAGRRFRVSAGSFLQASPLGAAALGDAVRRALGDWDPVEDRLADLYGGIGLFTVLLGAARSVVVERSASSVADARVNTGALDSKVVRVAVERWRPSRAEAVVADPARSGLGRVGAAAVAATGARRVALVSCDAASLGRDVALLAGHGYRAAGVELVDMFPQTHHVEAVTTLELARSAP